MKSFSEVLEEEPWTKAKEAAALEEMRKKMEAKHVQKEAENEDEGNEKEGKSNEEKKAKDNSKNNNNNENNVGNNNNSGEEGEQAEKKKTRKKPSGPKLYLKEQVRSIKFNNNEINTWVGFDEALKNAIDSETVKSTDLQFLDCSFNMLQTIGSCLEKYDKIRVLYLHGNKIGNLQDIKRLKNLKEIQKLTLHGNPIEEKKNYRKTNVGTLSGFCLLALLTHYSGIRDSLLPYAILTPCGSSLKSCWWRQGWRRSQGAPRRPASIRKGILRGPRS